MDDPKTPESQQSGAPLSRRELIKRGIALGSLPYVAPMILGSTTPVSAQVLSGFGCTTFFDDCDAQDESALCAGDPDTGPFCICVESLDGPACVIATCEEQPTCDGAGDCEPGFFCLDISDWGNVEECDCPNTRFCIPSCALLDTLTAVPQSPQSHWPPFASLR